ncbi:hypothetical protein G3T18_12805 [Oscillatoria salina IIICB1]|nr:hypothetical protein [Oscillatoria salina IIICB1]
MPDNLMLKSYRGNYSFAEGDEKRDAIATPTLRYAKIPFVKKYLQSK